jgi:hypothetical protein
MSASVETTKPEKPERWFEIEVMLFKQLGNKATLKEHFPEGIDSSNLPRYRQSFDLLSPYLQPNLSRIKSFVPLCGEKNEQQLFLESLQSVTTPFPEQIKLIEQVALFAMPDFTQLAVQENSQARNIESNIEESDIAEVNIEGNNADEDNNGESELDTQAPNSTQALTASSDHGVEEIKERPESVAFEFDLQEETLAKPIFSTQNLCIITQHEIENLFNQEELVGFNLDSFAVEALPSKLNAAGLHKNESPYLIADESLLLKDINQRLRWSKEFKPLLHFGWRQVGITQKQAIPLKLFAGEHLEYKYQQALKSYQIELEAAQVIENNLLVDLAQAQNTSQTTNRESIVSEGLLLTNEFTDNTNKEPVDNKLIIETEQKQRILNQLLSRIELVKDTPFDSDTVTDIVTTINGQNLDSFLPSNQNNIILNDQQLNITSPPKKPLQPWFLDGFIKVHLDHYLFITADFNVFNQEQVNHEIENDENNDIKLVNFSQNRRVITGEIHYFDHPYIGMVVQIRRFDPSKPADEAISQAIK